MTQIIIDEPHHTKQTQILRFASRAEAAEALRDSLGYVLLMPVTDPKMKKEIREHKKNIKIDRSQLFIASKLCSFTNTMVF